jgi:hypothetical protein
MKDIGSTKILKKDRHHCDQGEKRKAMGKVSNKGVKGSGPQKGLKMIGITTIKAKI